MQSHENEKGFSSTIFLILSLSLPSYSTISQRVSFSFLTATMNVILFLNSFLGGACQKLDSLFSLSCDKQVTLSRLFLRELVMIVEEIIY